MTPPLLTLRELSTEMGVSYGTMRKHVERHGLRPRVPGGRGRAARFDIADVRTWLESRSVMRAAEIDPLERVTRRVARIPEIIAEAAWSTHILAGWRKNLVAQDLAVAALLAIQSIHDELADVLPRLPAVDDIPAKLTHLRKLSGAIRKP